MSDTSKRGRGPLEIIEWVGNKLPDPVVLFLLGCAVVMAVSHLAASQGWVVQPKGIVQVVDEATGQARTELVDRGSPIAAKSLVTAEGLFWCLDKMITNFMGFPPLGIVLTGMLGIGVAERTGLIGAGLKAFMQVVPNALLTPAMVFAGVMSSLGIDAGYVVLPPLAAALYKSVGRSPLAGIAAVFAGVSAGFNANLFITGLDPMLASLTQGGARVIDPDYAVAATSNWWFAIASTLVITAAGWMTTALFVERRLSRKSAQDGGPSPIDQAELAAQRLRPAESRGLAISAAAFALLVGGIVALVLIPGSPLHDRTVPGDSGVRLLADPVVPPAAIPEAADAALVVEGKGRYLDAKRTQFLQDDGDLLAVRQPPFPRWVKVITPLIFLGFVIPGLLYGVLLGSIKNGKDAARLMVESIAAMAPIIVLSFFAAQFIEYLKYTQLDRMMAFSGGEALTRSGLGPSSLIVAFIVVTMVFNLFIGSMSAKYTMFAPIFVPMLMFAGISPELTQAAYRVGDSTTNIITPLNAYLVIVLVYLRQYAPRGGMGTLIAMMMPYTVVFTIAWTGLLLLWMALGMDLGPGAGLTYSPSAEP